jgi:hypothetical protein
MIQELSNDYLHNCDIGGGQGLLVCGVWSASPASCFVVSSCTGSCTGTIGWIDCGLSTKNVTMGCGSPHGGYEMQENAIVECYADTTYFCSGGGNGQGHYCIW